MIGGIDVQIPTWCGRFSAEIAVRAIRQKWPHAAYEDGITGERYSQFSLIPFGATDEIFVYRDCASADHWDTEGAIPSLYNTMIHIVTDEDLLTLVVDRRDAEIEEIIVAVSSALSSGNQT